MNPRSTIVAYSQIPTRSAVRGAEGKGRKSIFLSRGLRGTPREALRRVSRRCDAGKTSAHKQTFANTSTLAKVQGGPCSTMVESGRVAARITTFMRFNAFESSKFRETRPWPRPSFQRGRDEMFFVLFFSFRDPTGHHEFILHNSS